MKKNIISLFASAFFLSSITSHVLAQNAKGGKVEYEQFNYFVFEERPEIPEWKEFIKTLPGQTKDNMVLLFDQNAALYKQSSKPEDAMDARMKKGIAQYEAFLAPKPMTRMTYHDFKTGELIDQLSFMSRFFILESKVKARPWKIGVKQVEILGYTCREAAYKNGDETITAWFTTDIPISAGPAEYEGLPGLILAVEVNGRNAILATNVDLTFQVEGEITKPKEGQKVKGKQFDAIVQEKIKEWTASGGPQGTPGRSKMTRLMF